MRRLIFNGDDDEQARQFGSLVLVWANAQGPTTFEELATASAVKGKLFAISESVDGNADLMRQLKPGQQVLLLRNAEWDYLKARLTPPLARWPNAIADTALQIIECVRDAAFQEDA